MNEGIPKVQPQEELVSQAEKELTVEQLQMLSDRFPDGPQTPEDQLLYNRLVLEMATYPKTNINEVIEKFKTERETVLEKGGFEPENYIVEKGGVVSSPKTQEDTPAIH